MLPILESRILELYDQRVDNEKQKKIEDKNWRKWQRGQQKRLLKPLHLYLKTYGWVVFNVNTDKINRVYMRLDRNAKWTAFFCGGSTSLFLEVKQFRVDLAKKKKEKKIEIEYVSTFYRFSGMFVLQMIFFFFVIYFCLHDSFLIQFVPTLMYHNLFDFSEANSRRSEEQKNTQSQLRQSYE